MCKENMSYFRNEKFIEGRGEREKLMVKWLQAAVVREAD